MPEHDLTRRNDPEPAVPKRATPEPTGPLELAGQIGNSNMQRVAGSPALQLSPAAAGLMQRAPLARESEDLGPAAATPDHEVEAPAASPESGVEKLDEHVPDTTGPSGVESEPQGVSKEGGEAAADPGVSKQPEIPAGLVGPHGIESGKEGGEPAADPGVSKQPEIPAGLVGPHGIEEAAKES